MAIAFPPHWFGIDLDGSGLGTANSSTFDRASLESTREEIASRCAVNDETKK
jgi:hypothetical protein